MSTGIGQTLRNLGDAIEAIEAAGGRIADVTSAPDGLYADETVAVELDVRLPLLADARSGVGTRLTVTEAAIAGDGTLTLHLLATKRADADSAENSEASSRAHGDQLKGERETAVGDGTSTAAVSLPAYRDPDRLRAVYAEHDTFPAMTEALGVDVTPQTVRRYMVEYGIHEPAAEPAAPTDGPPAENDEAREAAPEATEQTEPAEAAEPEPSSIVSPATSPDGGSPRAEQPAEAPLQVAGVEHVDVAELREVLRNAQTIREVGQQLDISRERAFRLLNTLDLVDLVSGRLESANRSVSADEIDRRLANAAADGD